MTVFGKRDGGERLHQRASAMATRGTSMEPLSARSSRGAGVNPADDRDIQNVRLVIQPLVDQAIGPDATSTKPRGELARLLEDIIAPAVVEYNLKLNTAQRRDLITLLLNQKLAVGQPRTPAKTIPAEATARASLSEIVPRIYPSIMERIDSEVATRLDRGDLARQLTEVVAEILSDQKIQLNQREQRDIISLLLNDMLGLGPLEPLLADDSINDILVNGSKQIYVERKGKLELSGAFFRDNAHVMSIATRIVSEIGRRIDESNPLVDARLPDGSRVNIIIPPLAIDGPTISIRKFSKKTIDLDVMGRQNNMSAAMATVLKIAARSQLNILISGGTGSGKTTLLNALSQMIDPGERIVTIEDAAELQLQQPHVVRLETRVPNLEGKGEVSMRDLVKNALRMRPDRIILGEIRGSEALDMLQAMNTGHDGSLGTIHANRPREALTRLENMVGMSGINLPSAAVRTQIAAAVQMILQVSRMRDGVRRITSVTEVVGMDGDVITTQELFSYQFDAENADGGLSGRFECSGIRPHFMPRAEYHGLGRMLMEAIG